MNKNTLKTFTKILLVAIALYFFLVSIGLLGKAFKGFGKDFAETLLRTTSNPFIALFVGVYIRRYSKNNLVKLFYHLPL